MEDQTTNEDDKFGVTDVILLSTIATATIISVGVLAKLGADLATEGVLKFKARKANKTEV